MERSFGEINRQRTNTIDKSSRKHKKHLSSMFSKNYYQAGGNTALELKFAQGNEVLNLSSHKRVLSNEKIQTNLNFSYPRNGTILTTNVSHLSILQDNSDIEALVRGFASVNIVLRGKTFLFNHTDDIFKMRKPISTDEYKEGDKCTFWETKFKRDKSMSKNKTNSMNGNLKYKHLNWELCGDWYCKNCINNKRISQLRSKKKFNIWKICHGKILIRRKVLYLIDKIELLDEETQIHIKTVPILDKKIEEINSNIELIKDDQKEKNRMIKENRRMKE